MTSRAVFIAGAHTDIGKTHVACALIAHARAAGLAVDALKPVVSGFDPDDWAGSDPGRLLTALGRPLTTAALDAISPWRLTAPLAPPMAAQAEGRVLPLAPITALCRQRMAADGLLLIEGVGGLMSPIADDATGLDLMAALGLPTMLVGGSYLGAISHTLTAAAVMTAHGMAPACIVVSESADAPDFAQTLAWIARGCACPVIAAPRDAADWAPGAFSVLAALA